MKKLNEEIKRINNIILITEQGMVDKFSNHQSNKITSVSIQENYISSPEFKCLNDTNLSQAVSVAINDEKLNPLFVKYALGILGRESDFGSLGGWSGPSRYAIKAGPEYIMNKLRQNDTIKYILDWGAKKIFDKDSWVPSMGIAQMTPDLAEKFGVDLEGLMTTSGSLIAASYYLKDLYNSLKNYDDNQPSKILRNGKLITPEYSTGNARLDAAIMSYNSGNKYYLIKYCKTDNPNLMAPCSQAGKDYRPDKKNYPDLVLKVTNEEVKNYLPNLKTGKLSSTGYLKEVTERAKNYDCIG